MKRSIFLTACRISVVVFLMASGYNAKGQEVSETDFSNDPAYLGSVLAEKPDPNTLETPEIKKISFSFSTGMMLGTAGTGNAFGTAYVAPAVAYNISPRLRIRAGSLIFFNSFYYPAVSSSQTSESSSGVWNNLGLFVAADYFVTDRITLSGSYYKMPENYLFRQQVAPEVYNRYSAYYHVPSESLSLGLNYKIAKGFYLGAEFRFSNDYQPYMNSYPFLQGNTPYDRLSW